MTLDEWELFRVYENRGAAEAVACVLEGEGVPTRIESRRLEAALEAEYCLLVATTLSHRARWITTQAEVTDAELDFLATGRLPDSEQN